MEEKIFDRHLDDMIVDGLIKEAEQENADFEAAMRRMSKKDFEALVFGWEENSGVGIEEPKEDVELIEAYDYDMAEASAMSSPPMEYNIDIFDDNSMKSGMVHHDEGLPQYSAVPKPAPIRRKDSKKILLGIIVVVFAIALIMLLIYIF